MDNNQLTPLETKIVQEFRERFGSQEHPHQILANDGDMEVFLLKAIRTATEQGRNDAIAYIKKYWVSGEKRLWEEVLEAARAEKSDKKLAAYQVGDDAPVVVPYSQLDHNHCWNQGKSPACGLPLEGHTVCCLCAIPRKK
jgi:hypothetical protein